MNFHIVNFPVYPCIPFQSYMLSCGPTLTEDYTCTYICMERLKKNTKTCSIKIAGVWGGFEPNSYETRV
jgi:hypothetical protein